MRPFLGLCLIVACTPPKETPPRVASDDASVAPASLSDGGPLDAAVRHAEQVDAAGGDRANLSALDPNRAAPESRDGGPDLEAYRTRDAIGGKSIGHTSVVFKVKLEGGLDAVFKPRSRRGNTRYRGEVAAHRLALALALDNVPPVMVRTFDAGKLRSALSASGAGALFDQEAVIAKDGTVTGALIPWIAKLEFLPLEAEPWLSRWRGWLKSNGEIPLDQRQLAAQISTMVVFDYLTGNWDRWSGGNIGLDRARGALLFIDNDGAFYDPAPPHGIMHQVHLLEGIDHFSRRFVSALRSLDGARLAREIGDESPGVPLLSARALTAIEARRKHALELIDLKIARFTEAGTLSFE